MTSESSGFAQIYTFVSQMEFLLKGGISFDLQFVILGIIEFGVVMDPVIVSFLILMQVFFYFHLGVSIYVVMNP